jgi:ketosteroid isomerase-like protein
VSQANVEIVRRANALFNAGDWDALSELYHPDAELRDLRHAPDVPEVLRATDAINHVVANWRNIYDEFGAEVYEYIDAHPWVICDVRWHGKVRGSDVPIDGRSVDAYEIKDDKIVRAITSYRDVATALAAVGPQE